MLTVRRLGLARATFNVAQPDKLMGRVVRRYADAPIEGISGHSCVESMRIKRLAKVKTGGRGRFNYLLPTIFAV